MKLQSHLGSRINSNGGCRSCHLLSTYYVPSSQPFEASIAFLFTNKVAEGQEVRVLAQGHSYYVEKTRFKPHSQPQKLSWL